MKHWHYRMPNLKPMSHQHEGGGRKHEHAKLKGYGQTKKSLRIEYGQLTPRQKQAARDMGLRGITSDLVTYAVIARIVPILRP